MKTLVTSQVVIYLAKDGAVLKNPLRSLHTKGDFLNETLHTGLIMLDKAEPEELTEV